MIETKGASALKDIRLDKPRMARSPANAMKAAVVHGSVRSEQGTGATPKVTLKIAMLVMLVVVLLKRVVGRPSVCRAD
jgi:hypothetical protein